MEKFYIVTNEHFVKETKEFKENERSRNELINKFFKKFGISGSLYYISGDGRINSPFKDCEKQNINLYIEDNNENNKKFGKQLKKPIKFVDGHFLCAFKKKSSILKEFQQTCIDNEIIVNLDSNIVNNYFKELRMGGYSITAFELNGIYYLHLSTQKNGITPEYDGFDEIKGIEFYSMLEKIESTKTNKIET